MYTCMEYTLYDTIYSDDTHTLQIHVPPPPKKKNNKQTKTSPVPTCKITFDLS